MTVLETAKKYEAYMIQMRRFFHENPELPAQELQTLKTIAAELTDMGIEFVEIPNGGILAKVTGSTDNGRAVLIRADIDALPVTEAPCNLRGSRTCFSKNDGVMHACGHDAHTAMLLGAAKVLLEQKEQLEGTVYLCFERGEEGPGNVRYILAYAEKEHIHIDSAFGIHVSADLDSGKIVINDTFMNSGLMTFDVTIQGNGGHGSRPDRAQNPIDAFHAIYGAMQSLRLNKIDPYTPLTYSVGKLYSGEGNNVIPQSLTFGGTMRTFDPNGAGMIFHRELKNSIDSICELYHCRPIYNKFTRPGLAVVNDPECACLARTAIAAELGGDSVTTAEPWMGSDSFPLYQLLWPGVFMFLGIRNEEIGSGAAHHNPYFDVDESVLVKGAASSVIYATSFLKSDVDTSGRKAPGGYAEHLRRSEKWDWLEELYGESKA